MNIARQEIDSAIVQRPVTTAKSSHTRRRKTAQIKKLKQEISLLEQLCADIDPYQTLSPAQINDLAQAGIPGTLDPYALTNHLILKLEDALAELQRLQEL
jgi:hypothetical protein